MPFNIRNSSSSREIDMARRFSSPMAVLIPLRSIADATGPKWRVGGLSMPCALSVLRSMRSVLPLRSNAALQSRSQVARIHSTSAGLVLGESSSRVFAVNVPPSYFRVVIKRWAWWFRASLCLPGL